MLKAFYNTFGFAGALLVSFFSFIYIIFWMAGIAGIYKQPITPGRKWRLLVAILFPPYPFIWLIVDMITQYRYMKKEDPA